MQTFQANDNGHTCSLNTAVHRHGRAFASVLCFNESTIALHGWRLNLDHSLGVALSRLPPAIHYHTSHGRHDSVPSIIHRVHHNSTECTPLPDDSHDNPAEEEALGRNPITIERQWPQDNGGYDVDHEERHRYLQPSLNVFQSLWAERMYNTVKVSTR